MKKLSLIITLFITIGLSACGTSLEKGPCTNEVEFQYETTLDWFREVYSRIGTYDSYDDYLAAYHEPLETWQSLEAITTCDAALIDLMVNYLTATPEDEEHEDMLDEITYFDLDILHTGK